MKRSAKIKNATGGTATDHAVIVDALEDVGTVLGTVESSLSDGLQYSDLFEAMALEKPVKELINEAPEFYQAIQETALKVDLKPAILEARQRVAAKFPGQDLKITNVIFGILANSVSTLDFARRTYEEAGAHMKMWKDGFISLKPSQA